MLLFRIPGCISRLAGGKNPLSASPVGGHCNEIGRDSYGYTVLKEMKCSGDDSEILHGLVRDTSRKSEKHELFIRPIFIRNKINTVLTI